MYADLRPCMLNKNRSAVFSINIYIYIDPHTTPSHIFSLWPQTTTSLMPCHIYICSILNRFHQYYTIVSLLAPNPNHRNDKTCCLYWAGIPLNKAISCHRSSLGLVYVWWRMTLLHTDTICDVIKHLLRTASHTLFQASVRLHIWTSMCRITLKFDDGLTRMTQRLLKALMKKSAVPNP